MDSLNKKAWELLNGKPRHISQSSHELLKKPLMSSRNEPINNAEQFALNFYLDWLNNYLTVEKIAEHHEISVEFANQIIAEGKILHNNRIDAANETLIALRK